MFENIGIAQELFHEQFWIAQVPVVQPVTTPEEASLVFSGPKFFVALIAGLVLAFAIQLVLTNLSVAAGISYLGHQSDDSSSHSHSESGSFGGTIRKIGFAVGLWTLVTVTIALFIACLLAVKLSLIESAGLGAIVGLVIWGAYFSALVLVSSTTIGSWVGSVVNTATSAFQTLFGTATAAMAGKAAGDRMVATAEAAAAAVRRELTVGMDPVSIRENIEDYLDRLRPAELDMSRIRGEFENLINSSELKSLAQNVGPGESLRDRLSHIDRQTFVNLVSDRTDLSKRDANRIVDQLEAVWHQVLNQQDQKDVMGQLRDYLSSARPENLRSGELSSKLDELINEVRRSGQNAGQQSQSQSPSLIDRAVQYGMTALTGTVLGRADLSDLDVEKVLGQLQGFKDKLGNQADKLGSQVSQQVPALPFSPIRADVENYILNAYAWHLNRETIRHEFRDVIFDPEADPGTVRRQLDQFSRNDFVNLLTQRGDLSPARVGEIADQLESVRQDVLTTVRTTEDQEHVQDLRSRVDYYLRSANKSDLTAEGVDRDFKALLEDPDAEYNSLRDRLGRLDRATLAQLLATRTDLTPEETDQLLNQLESTRDRVLSDAQSLQDQAQAKATEVQQRLEDYLRNTGKSELNPDGIKRDLSLLVNHPQAGVSALRSRASEVDRETLVQLLAQRPDINEEEARRIVDQVANTWSSLVHAPQAMVGKTKEQYDKTTTAIADYLRRTNLRELDPNGIQRDLSTLLHDPKEGTVALRRRLSQIDRETLVKLLSQREDLSEAQVNQMIDQVQDAIRQLARAPRRLAARTQQGVRDFQANLENYLRNTDKEELNPDGIKRDLQLLVSDPRSGLGSISDRLSRFDRSTIVALLSQRSDMSEAEANRVVDQVLSVRDQIRDQIQNIQYRIQSIIDSIFARIRNYLNALDRPELNYDGIKRDLRTLFDDPQAGFDALRARLGQFDRGTLVALLSSREDISEADANRVIDQIESARNSVLQRAERIQQEAQRRLDEVKLQAQRQAEETRKAAESAAWWLFGTAVVSACASAIAGAIAV
jgi:nucleoid DNA-binding protein